MDFDLMGMIMSVHNQDFTQKLELFIIAWVVVRRTVNKHFTQVEKSMQAVVEELSAMRSTIQQVVQAMANHSERIQGLEKRMDTVEQKTKGVNDAT